MKYCITVLIAISIITSNAMSASSCSDHDHEEIAAKPVAATEHNHEEAGHDHEEEAEHADEDSHDEASHSEDAHEEGYVINLTAEQIAETGITVEKAEHGTIDIYKSFPASITFNRDKMAYIVPRVAGIVSQITVSQGSKVEPGQLMAVIESKELADIKAEYMLAADTEKLAADTLKREQQLFNDNITSKQDYLQAQSEHAQAAIQKKNAWQKIKAVGFTDEYINSLPTQDDKSLTRYEIKAPMTAVVIERPLVTGQFIDETTELFVIADTTTLWADINIYPAYINAIKTGGQIEINAGNDIEPTFAHISYISPVVSDSSRTILTRAVIDNTNGLYRPGLFAKANIAVSSTHAHVAIPQNAIVTLENKKCVFILDEDGFEPRFVTIGQSNSKMAEITSGLEEGEMYVSNGAFELKSKIITSTLGSHAGHGH